MEEVDRTRILAKIGMIWDANPSESFFSLLAQLCGEGTTSYIFHSYIDGRTDKLEARTFSNICEVDDVDLEEALDDLID